MQSESHKCNIKVSNVRTQIKKAATEQLTFSSFGPVGSSGTCRSNLEHSLFSQQQSSKEICLWCLCCNPNPVWYDEWSMCEDEDNRSPQNSISTLSWSAKRPNQNQPFAINHADSSQVARPAPARYAYRNLHHWSIHRGKCVWNENGVMQHYRSVGVGGRGVATAPRGAVELSPQCSSISGTNRRRLP